MPDFIKQYLDHVKEMDQCRSLRGISPLNSAECLIGGNLYINFSSNNYMALADHPALKAEAARWTEKYGVGATASRLTCGTLEEVLELEAEIAKWKKTEAAAILGSGYMANSGILAALGDRSTVIFADKLNHASLNNGCILSGAKFIRYRHKDMKHLRDALSQYSFAERKIIVSDTVFSMDGDIADLNEISSLAAEFKTMLYLDDAHGTGVFGESGEGLAGAESDIAMGTFSKAMGSFGAYAACSAEMKEFLVNRCGPLIYSTALPPAVYGAIAAAVRLVQTSEFTEIRSRLLENASLLRGHLSSMGYDIGSSTTHIIPVIVHENSAVLRLSNFLYEHGILAVGIRPPTVPENGARIRLSLNAAHSDAHISKLIETFKEARRKLF